MDKEEGRVVRLTPAKVKGAPNFRPWMGENYLADRAAMIAGTSSCCSGLWHVMGESHYGDPNGSSAESTCLAIERLALLGYPFFDTIISAILGKDIDQLDRASAWNDFAFSNFVQDVLPNDNRRPRPEDWQKGRDSFFGQLAITRPKQLLVVGKEQWDNLPNEGFVPVEPFQIDKDWDTIDGVGVYSYEVDGQVCFTVATWIYHPSSRGLLDLKKARTRVESVAIASCNILSSYQVDDIGWFYVDASLEADD